MTLGGNIKGLIRYGEERGRKTAVVAKLQSTQILNMGAGVFHGFTTFPPSPSFSQRQCGNELILPVKKFCGTSQWSTGKLIDAFDFGRKHERINKVWRGERKEDRSVSRVAEYSTPVACTIKIF
jgi:hypothetical protein